MIDVVAERLPPDSTISRWDRDIPLTTAVRDVHVILPSNARITAEVIEHAGALRLIQQPAAGVDGIDLHAAAQRDIPVCNAPGTNHVSVAEAALLLILSLARRVNEARSGFAQARIGVPLGMEICGKTLGIIGFGKSGQALGERARALGMTIRTATSKTSRPALYSLLADSDVISLHCPLNPATRGLLDNDAFAAMKPGALLINCARGPVIDRAALDDALERGQLGGLGLDTFWAEPWDPDDPLYARDDVVVLPHVAGSTRESFGRIAAVVCQNLARLTRGDPLLHRVA